MAKRELYRVQVLTLVLEGQLPLKNAAERMNVSYRQAKRLKRKMLLHGPPGLVHGNQARIPHNKTTQKVTKRILELASGSWGVLNDTHFAELLLERECIYIGRETLRRILRTSGLPPKRKRRPKRYYKHRERSPSKGLMLIWDGSPHHWFGQHNPACCLMSAVDDADTELIHAFFCTSETSEAYMRLLKGIIRKRGIPVSIYMDMHSALKRNDSHWSLEEQLAGKRKPTQVGIALEELSIQPIYALSAQAKGRIERNYGVLQDRLVAEMEIDGIDNIEDANKYLQNGGLRRFNKRFKVKPASNQSSFRQSKGVDLKTVLSFRYQATVANDNTISIGGMKIQIPPGSKGRGYAKSRVDVRQHLDGSWSVYYHGHCIAKNPRTPLREPVRYRRKPTKNKVKRGAFDEVLLYSPASQPQPGDIFAGL